METRAMRAFDREWIALMFPELELPAEGESYMKWYARVLKPWYKAGGMQCRREKESVARLVSPPRREEEI